MKAFQEALWIQEVIREVGSKPEKYSIEKYFIKRQKKKTEITQLGVIEKRILSMAAYTDRIPRTFLIFRDGEKD